MPTFDSSGTVTTFIDIADGAIRIEATDRSDIVVDVSPLNPADNADHKAAEKATVTFDHDQLTVAIPKHIFSSISGAVNVLVQLPARSELQIDAKAATVECIGELGDTTIKSATGRVNIAHTAGLTLSSGRGDVTVDTISGAGNLTIKSGATNLGVLDGDVNLKSVNGNTLIGASHGPLSVVADNGAIEIDELTAGADLKAANGKIRIGELFGKGRVVAKAAFGDIEIGVRAGTLVKLDLHSGYGTVLNGLESAEMTNGTGDAVELMARSDSGDVEILRV